MIILDTTPSRPTWRIRALELLIFCGLLALLVTMAFRQLAQGNFWTGQMAQSSTRVVKLPAPRGVILDRNGAALVENRPSYNVALYLDEFGTGHSLPKLIQKVRWTAKKLQEEMKMPVHVNDRVVKVHYAQRGPLPLTVWNDLSPAALAIFEEHSPLIGPDRKYIPGVGPDIEPVRVYPHGTLASHILGYVGKPETTDEEEENMDFDSAGRRAFSLPSVVGKSGIEAAMDSQLEGVEGRRIIRLNAQGMEESVIQNSQPTEGNRVVLTLDWRIQQIVEESFTGYRGACVVMDPRNGDILAMASAPSFDPNRFVPAIMKKDWNTLIKDNQHPLINRAIQGSYAPGSIFKVIVALAGLESGLATPTTIFECPGYFDLGPLRFRCWETGGHGDMNMFDALTMSCDVYFYNLGLKIGGKAMGGMAEAFGLGQVTGVGLDHENPGILPTEAWKRKNRPRDGYWSQGDSVNMSIGQGYLGVTPTQMAVVASAIANGGTVVRPRLVLRVETPEGETITDFPPAIRGHVPATPEHIEFVRKAMLNVVENGTGKKAAVDKVQVAGKTGSAQYSTRDPATGQIVKQPRAWMIAFAPYQDPRYAISVVAEGGESGGHVAGPFVSAILKRVFQLEKDDKSFKPPPSLPALPVTEKIEGTEGEVGGELMEENKPPPPKADDADQNIPPPPALPAERVNID